MNKLKTMNDVNDAYDKGLIQVGESYICPVCNKKYKKKKSAENHIEKRNCYSTLDLFKNTMHESTAYMLYKQILGEYYESANTSLHQFRKSKSYGPVVRFVLFTNKHGIGKMKELYLSWLHSYKKCNHLNKLMSEGVKESNLREFRVFIQRYNYIECKEFYRMNRDRLMEDGEFFIRSLETARLGLKFLLEQEDFDFEHRMETLEPDYAVRFVEFNNEILGG